MITRHRRQFLKVSVVAAAGYAIAAEPIPAQAIHTDTNGLVAGEASVSSGGQRIPAYQVRPDKPGQFPIILVISDIWACTSTSVTSYGVSPRKTSTPSLPRCSIARAVSAI